MFLENIGANCTLLESTNHHWVFKDVKW
jgi:hypothetical protein